MWDWASKPYVYIAIGAIFSIIGGVMSALQSERFEKDVHGNILGGDSYCYLLRHLDESGYLYFSLQHVGKYPMYNVEVVIRDITLRSELMNKMSITGKDMTEEEWKKIKEGDFLGKMYDLQNKSKIFSQSWPSIQPGAMIIPIFRIKLPENKIELRFLGKIYARNVTITQPIRFLKINEKWKDSTRIQKFDSKKPGIMELRKDIDPEVPLEETCAGE